MTTLNQARDQVVELKKAHANHLQETRRTPRIYRMYRGRKALDSYAIRFELTPANPRIDDPCSPFSFVLEE